MDECSWLPPLIEYDSSEQWVKYEDGIYNIFKDDFIDSYPIIDGFRVNIRYHPIENGKADAFFHVTCQDYMNIKDRSPDFRRCERIRWVRKFIENMDCNQTCNLCEGLKVWDKPYKNTYRTHILFEKEKFMVVIEKRDKYYLLITAFYFDRDHTLGKKLKEYEQYKNK